MTQITPAPITTPSWSRTRSSTRSCSGSGTRWWSSGAGRARGRTGGSTTCTRAEGSTSSARTATCGRLSRTRILRGDGGWGVGAEGLRAQRRSGRRLGRCPVGKGQRVCGCLLVDWIARGAPCYLVLDVKLLPQKDRTAIPIHKHPN